MSEKMNKYLVNKVENEIVTETFGAYNDEQDAQEALRILDFLYPNDNYELWIEVEFE